MTIYNDIRAAFETKLNTEASLTGFEKAFENVSYDPTTGVSFIKVVFVPTSRRSAVRGLNPQQRYQGVFRVFCYAPEGNGPSIADDMANKVMIAFNAATDISFTDVDNNTINVSIDYSERDSGFVDTPWYYTVVNIGWYVYAA